MFVSVLKVIALVSLLIIASPLYAKDIFSFSLGIDQWKNDAPSTYGVASDNLLEFKDDGATARQLELSLSHKLPLIPNIRYAMSSTDQTANNTLAQTYVLGGEVFSVASQLSSENKTQIHDVLLSYPMLDFRLLKIDMGLLARYQKLEINTSKIGDTQQSMVDSDKIVPMLHVNLESGVPLLGFFVFAEFNKGDNNHLYQSGIGYTFDNNLIPDVDLRVGFRNENIDFTAGDGVIFHQELDATFAGMRVRF